MQHPEFKIFTDMAISLKPFCWKCLPANEKKRDQLLSHMFMKMDVAAYHKRYTHKVSN